VPFWSPDSRYVAFDAGGKLKKVDVATGSVHTVCSVPGDIAGGSWNKHDVIIFGIDVPGHGIMRVSAASGEPEVVIGNADFARPGVRFLFPTFLPDGKHFLYRRNGPPAGIYVGSLEAKPQQQSDMPLVRSDAAFFSYVSLPNSAAGQLLFTREGTLLAQKFDPETLQLTGDAVSIVEDAFPDDGNVPRGLFSVSAADVLVYAGGDRGRQWMWVDRKGKVVENLGQTGQMVALSRDATKLAFTRFVRPRDSAVWLMDLATRQVSQLTFNSGVHQNPVWSWDAGRVAFVFYQPDGSGFSVYKTLSSGTGNEEPLVQPKTSLPNDWWRDYLLYQRRDPKTKADVWVRQLESGEDFPMVATEADETYGRVSPDGRTIAYVSDEGGRSEIWVAPLSVSSAGAPVVVGGKRKISSNGGTRVLWRRDGKELFYLSLDGTIMAVDVTHGSTFPYGNPYPLFQTTSGPFAWDVAPNGQRFIVQASLDGPTPPAVVVLNWTRMLKN
jgi:Tol biopolymer transport system component